MNIKYIVTETTYNSGAQSRTGYGIAAVTVEDGVTVVLRSANDLTPDKSKAENLADLCNAHSLSLLHIEDVVDDLIG